MSASRPAALRAGDEAEVEARGLGERTPGGAQQRHDARLPASGAQPLQPLRHEIAVVGVERHHIGDRAERDEIRQGTEVRFCFFLEKISST
jgi:hypothetical protein